MRQGSNARRPRGRPHRRQNGGINKNANFDSNGPEGRVRGNAHQVYEKYINLARDATSAGDRILAESFYQFAEHYYRIVNDSMDPNSGQPRRQDGEDSQQKDGGQHAQSNDEDRDDGDNDRDRDAQAQGGGRPRRGRMNGRPRNQNDGEQQARSGSSDDQDDRGNRDDRDAAGEPSADNGDSDGKSNGNRELPGLGEQPSLADAIDQNDKAAEKPRRRGRPRKNQDQDGGPVSA